MRKNIKLWYTALWMLLSFTGAITVRAEETVMTDDSDSWAIYWYLCGSDLESENGAATLDLLELMEVSLPENVKIVIETGGASAWDNEVIDADMIQRYVYEGNELYLVDEQPSASMGSAQTLAEFLEFAAAGYPAEKTAVIFWNHGGGSVSGVAFDECYDYDSLTLTEIQEAFSSVWMQDRDNPPLELIGFDACLMATIDVAYVCSEFSHYLVASEETEPGNGWNYTGCFGALAEDPWLNGAGLGKAICDSFQEGCLEYEMDDCITLSVTDLNLAQELFDAYDEFGHEALTCAIEDPGFISDFSRAARASENYGGNTKQEGYTNMVDLGSLSREVSSFLPSAARVQEALNQCVIYKIQGPYREESSGLSCYYSYSGDQEDLSAYCDQGSSTSNIEFSKYILTGEIEEVVFPDTDTMKIEDLPTRIDLTDMGWEDISLTENEEGYFYMDLGVQADEILSGVCFDLYYYDEEEDLILLLGSDNDIDADWDNGIFTDHFRGVWGSIDGNPVYMELSYEGEDYNLYTVPVLINGEEYHLQVNLDLSTEIWTIMGARKSIDENGMADKNLRLLQEGDEITILWYMASLSGEDDFEPYEMDTVIYTEDTAFYETDLGEGDFALCFEMYDACGNTVYSDLAYLSL